MVTIYSVLVSLFLLISCSDESLDRNLTQANLRKEQRNAAKNLANKLGLPKEHSCGPIAGSFKPNAKVAPKTVFLGVKDQKSHINIRKWNKCIAELLQVIKESPSDSFRRKFIYFQVLYTLDTYPVAFYKLNRKTETKRIKNLIGENYKVDIAKYDRMAILNKKNLPYNAMTQSDLGNNYLEIYLTLLQTGAGASHFAQFFMHSAISVLNATNDTKIDGGLKEEKRCEKNEVLRCAWFYSVTGTSRASSYAGGTLNQHVNTSRDLFRADKLFEKISAIDPSFNSIELQKTFRMASAAGVNQLFLSKSATKAGDTPLLEDFIPRNPNNQPILNSWLYYSRSFEKNNFYFLSSETKNCTYHLYELSMLASLIPQLIAEGLISENMLKTPIKNGDSSALRFMADTYLLKLNDGAIYEDSISQKKWLVW